MKIDVETGDTFVIGADKDCIIQVRSDKGRLIGSGSWFTHGHATATPSTIEDARTVAKIFGHELVMPEEKVLAYAVNDSGCMMTYRSRRERDGCIPGTGFVACSPTGEVTPAEPEVKHE